jgi:allophanate hydrolase
MWQKIDVLLVPTAPTHYTIAQMQADPIALNRNLGFYTNFVNLLDYAAISVPSSIRPDGLPFGITLIGQCGSDWKLAELGQRYHHATGLTMGATGQPLPAPEALSVIAAPAPGLKVAVVGAQTTHTANQYRLYALPGTVPPKPGLKRVEAQGAAIAVEVWDIPLAQVGSFLALIPSPLGLGKLELADGTWVTGFVCEGYALDAALDVTAHGGWRAYMGSLKP